MRKGGWPDGYISVANIIEQIPNDGCLLVFNADHANWRVKVAATGVLRCQVAHNGHVSANAPVYAKIRDLYISWKD